MTLRLVAVTPAYRGMGLGRRLLEEVEAAAIQLGGSEISLAAGDAARGFYLRMGYSGRARLRKQFSLAANARRGEGWRRELDELRRRRERRLAVLRR